MTEQLSLREELRRRKSQNAKVLLLLRNSSYVTTADLRKVAAKYTSRVSDLRKDGHDIQCEYLRPGMYRYWVVEDADEEGSFMDRREYFDEVGA